MFATLRLKQWKRPRTIFRNLTTLNRMFGGGFGKEQIRQTANSRIGWYRTGGMRTANYLLSPEVLGMKKWGPARADRSPQALSVTQFMKFQYHNDESYTRPVRTVQRERRGYIKASSTPIACGSQPKVIGLIQIECTHTEAYVFSAPMRRYI